MPPSARTRANPDRAALIRDVLEQIDPTETELWRERWEHARETAVDDVQAELLEGLRDFAQQFQDQVFTANARLLPDEQQALQAWLATAPATFRPGSPLERGEVERAAEEANRNYAECVLRLFPDRPDVQSRMLGSKMRAFVQAFWRRVLTWTARTLDQALAHATELLWAFPPFQEALTPALRAAGPDALHAELRARVLAPFPRTTAGDPVGVLEGLT